MLQRLPITLAQVKSENRSEHLKTKLEKLFLVLSKTNYQKAITILSSWYKEGVS